MYPNTPVYSGTGSTDDEAIEAADVVQAVEEAASYLEDRDVSDVVASVKGPALSPEEALKKMTVPEGFTVELVASEPMICEASFSSLGSGLAPVPGRASMSFWGTTSSANRMVDMARAPSRGRMAPRYCLVRITNRAMPTLPLSSMALVSRAYGLTVALSGATT